MLMRDFTPGNELRYLSIADEALRDHHVERLKNKKCSARTGMLYLDMLTNLERIGDHAENIATSVDKETPVAAW